MKHVSFHKDKGIFGKDFVIFGFAYIFQFI